MPPDTLTRPLEAAWRWRRVALLYAALLAANAAAWLWAFTAFRPAPVLLGTALLAYSLGLRHAVDADHIAAIDNVTRRLMQQGERPVTVGLWFSLGHSTVVVAGATAIAATALTLQPRWATAVAIGGVLGTLVSAVFLFAIAAANWVVLTAVRRAFRRARRGESYIASETELMFSTRGLLARLFGPVLGMVRRSRRMYLVGLLFGLGFDTATEVGVLGLAAVEAAKGMAFWEILVFPALFAAGMALIDATDNVLMLGAYGWAFAQPVRKLYYNLTITAVSILVAAAVGGVEVLGLVAGVVPFQGVFWSSVRRLNANFAVLGYSIIGVFVVCCLVSVGIYKWKGFDELPAPEPGWGEWSAGGSLEMPRSARGISKLPPVERDPRLPIRNDTQLFRLKFDPNQQL